MSGSYPPSHRSHRPSPGGLPTLRGVPGAGGPGALCAAAHGEAGLEDAVRQREGAEEGQVRHAEATSDGKLYFFSEIWKNSIFLEGTYFFVGVLAGLGTGCFFGFQPGSMELCEGVGESCVEEWKRPSKWVPTAKSN